MKQIIYKIGVIAQCGKLLLCAHLLFKSYKMTASKSPITNRAKFTPTYIFNFSTVIITIATTTKNIQRIKQTAHNMA
jgi:hypothetical protein